MSEVRLRVRLLHGIRLYGQPYMGGAELDLPIDEVRKLLRHEAVELANPEELPMLLWAPPTKPR